MDIDQVRANLDAAISVLPIDADARFTPVDAGGIRAEWTLMPGSLPSRTVYYLHGGGYVWGSPKTHRSLTAKLAAEAQARVLAVDYRLAPEHRFPAGLDDVIRGYRWLSESVASPKEIAVCGDSAGGGLAMGLLVALRDRQLPVPACAVVFSPWADLTGESETYVTRAAVDPILDAEGAVQNAALYLAGADPRGPLASPALTDLSGLPPVLVQVGDDEVLLGDSEKLAAGIRASGGEVTLTVWKDMWHVFQMSHASVPDAARAVSDAGSFMKTCWRRR